MGEQGTEPSQTAYLAKLTPGNMNELVPSPAASKLADLKPVVQQQVLNPPSLAPVTQSRTIRKNEKMSLQNLQKLVNEGTAMIEHKGLS